MREVQNFGLVEKLAEKMKKRNTPIEKRGKSGTDSIPLKYCVLTLICGTLLVVGLFWAARQHFSAMDFGIRNAKLKQQKESLEADLRRLNLAKEIALSPGEIKKVAKKIGLQNLMFQSSEVVAPTPKTEKATTAEKPVIAKKESDKPKGTKAESATENKVEKPKKQPVTAGDIRPQIAKK